ncbi:MAG: C39 family peptidase [Candidatus Jorgensenbacteria bacterium]|nr:C39 family peptidase [Candidatus Jorgensenbacteria bacterium]
MRFNVPAYSQYLDVKSRAWKRRSCGIVALKMALDHYAPNRRAAHSLSHLIAKRSRADAYIRNVGWSHRGLVRIAQRHGFRAKNYDWWGEKTTHAFSKLRQYLAKGPLLASIYRNLKTNAHGHLVVVTGFQNGTVFYYDPDSKTRRGIPRRASQAKFLRGWKRRIIVVRPPSRGYGRAGPRLRRKK